MGIPFIFYCTRNCGSKPSMLDLGNVSFVRTFQSVDSGRGAPTWFMLVICHFHFTTSIMVFYSCWFWESDQCRGELGRAFAMPDLFSFRGHRHYFVRFCYQYK